MNDFKKICRMLEDLDEDTYRDLLARKSADVLAGLSGITENGLTGISVFADFVLCAVAADGKLTEEEYLLLKPTLDLALGADTTFEDAKKVFYSAGLDKPKDYKKTMDLMVDMLGLVSPELKEDIVVLCLLVCAVDGKVSRKERKWIEKLVE